MKNELTDYEKALYKFANECALKGIDIEETFGAVWKLTKEVFEQVVNLTNKNFEYLKKCINNTNDNNVDLVCDMCGKQDKTVKKCIDPYDKDVNDLIKNTQLCDECYQRRVDEI